MDSGKLGEQRHSPHSSQGDDETARKQVVDLARSIGFDPVDSGPLKNARLLEPLAFFNIQLGYGLGSGYKYRPSKLLHDIEGPGGES
jgi:hypothetical protein